MARHYSARNFFRHIPSDLLARYSESRGLGSELDFAAWLELPEKRQRALEAEFRQIFEMSSEKGTCGHSRRGAPAVAGRSRPIDRLHRNPLVAARPLPPGDGHLPGPPGNAGGAPPGSVTPGSFPIGASASTWDTGLLQPTRPASSTFPA